MKKKKKTTKGEHVKDIHTLMKGSSWLDDSMTLSEHLLVQAM